MGDHDEGGWEEGGLGLMSRRIMKDGEVWIEAYTDPLKKAAAA